MDWWFLVNRATIDLPAGISQVSLPVDFIRIAEQSIPLLLDETGKPLGKLARAYYEDAVVCPPDETAYYVLEGDLMWVYPAPTMPRKLQIQYVKKDAELSATVLSNQWTARAYQLLMCKAGIALAQALQAKDALENFSADYAASYSECFKETVARSDLTFSQSRE